MANLSESVQKLADASKGMVSVQADLSSIPPKLEFQLNSSTSENMSSLSALKSGIERLIALFPKVIQFKDGVSAIIDASKTLPQKIAEEIQAAKLNRDLTKAKSLVGASKIIKQNTQLTLETPNRLRKTIQKIQQFFSQIVTSFSN